MSFGIEIWLMVTSAKNTFKHFFVRYHMTPFCEVSQHQVALDFKERIIDQEVEKEKRMRLVFRQRGKSY